MRGEGIVNNGGTMVEVMLWGRLLTRRKQCETMVNVFWSVGLSTMGKQW